MIKTTVNVNGFLGIIIILIYITLSFTKPAIFDNIEGVLFDTGTRFASEEDQDSGDIVVIEIDNKSIKHYGPWPWPRYIIADMINLLNQKGVKVIGLNISFSEKQQNHGLLEVKAFREKFTTYSYDRVSPGVTDWIMENLNSLEKELDDDKKLVESLHKAGNVILPVSVRNEGQPEKITREEDLLLASNFLTQRPGAASIKNSGIPSRLSFPFFELMQQALGLGYKISSYEKQPTGRTHPMYVLYESSPLPSFPFRMAIAYFNQLPRQVIVDKYWIHLGGYSIPITKGKMLIESRTDADRFPRYPFVDVLQTENKSVDLNGKIVVIGFKSGVDRWLPTTGFSRTSDTERVSRILHNIIHKDFIFRPPVLVYIEMLTTLIMGGVGAFFFPRVGYLRGLGLAVGLTVLTTASEIFLLSMMAIWFKTAYITACLFTIYGAISISLMLTSAKSSKKTIEGQFRDLDQRIPKLIASEKSPTIGVQGDAKGMAVDEDFAPGVRTQVGRYEVLEVLGKGSMGLVYKALDPRMNRTLAIKTIRFSDEFDEEVIQEIKVRFFREAEIAGKLAHPSIVTIFDVGEDGDLTYMAMEYLEGKDLETFVSKENLLPFRKVLDVAAAIADALDYAHSADVIHRDIKPANVMLLDRGGVKVTDFGIAKAISSSRTKTGVILGTPNYMSPEQIMGQKIDPKSDIFSLGVLFFQLLTGELPFHGDNLSSLLYQITQVKHPPLRNYNPRIPKICEQIVDRALAKNPTHRFRNAGEFAKVLRLLDARIVQLMQRRSGETKPLSKG